MNCIKFTYTGFAFSGVQTLDSNLPLVRINAIFRRKTAHGQWMQKIAKTFTQARLTTAAEAQKLQLDLKQKENR